MTPDTIDKLLDDLKGEEGFRAKVYQCPAGRWTIGYGRNVQDLGITEDEAEYLLAGDVGRVIDECERAFPWFLSAPPEIQQATAHLCFWVGLTSLLGFRKYLGACERGDRLGAAQEVMESALARQVPQRAARVSALLRGS